MSNPCDLNHGPGPQGRPLPNKISSRITLEKQLQRHFLTVCSFKPGKAIRGEGKLPQCMLYCTIEYKERSEKKLEDHFYSTVEGHSEKLSCFKKTDIAKFPVEFRITDNCYKFGCEELRTLDVDRGGLSEISSDFLYQTQYKH